jgi:hypothetical protein
MFFIEGVNCSFVKSTKENCPGALEIIFFQGSFSIISSSIGLMVYSVKNGVVRTEIMALCNSVL